jgi:ribose 5-phosphate isomerase B
MIKDLKLNVVDVGVNENVRCDYPDFGVQVAQYVAKDPSFWGVVICGSGIGITISTNKVK